MPAAAGRDFELAPILQSLEPFRERLNVVSGLRLPAAYVGASSAAANHSRSSQCWLSCMPDGQGPSPTTVDQLAARHIGQETPLPSLELALEAGASISYLTPQTPLPMETNPRVVFERLLGDGSTPEERAARQRQLSSLLDSVTGQVATLKRDLPGPDRERMDRYLTDVRELERRLSLAADSALTTVEVPDKPNGIPADFEEHAMLMFDLLVLAWAADLTRIATFMVSRELSNRLYPRSGVNEGFHNASHHSGIPANIERLAKLNEYHTRTTIAYLLRKLADTPDGDGSLLDHSLIVYGSGMANPNQHDHDPLPMLVAGGGSGRLQGGRHIRAAGRHAVREPARERARQARRARRRVRRQHGRVRDLTAAACAFCGPRRRCPSLRHWPLSRPLRPRRKTRRSHPRPPTCRRRRSRRLRSAATRQPCAHCSTAAGSMRTHRAVTARRRCTGSCASAIARPPSGSCKRAPTSTPRAATA